MNARLLPALTALLAAAVSPIWAQTQSTTLTVDAGTAKAESSPTLYGLMTEEINHSYDGGLYGELLRNNVIAGKGWGSTDFWSMVQRGTSAATMSLDTTTGPSAALPYSLKLEVTAASNGSSAGLQNEGYWGIPLHPGTTYHASFYAKAAQPGTDVTITLLDDTTGKAVAQKTISDVENVWKRYTTELTISSGSKSSVTSAHNHFIVSLSKPGTLWINMATLFGPTYHNRTNGNRIDLMEMLAAMHPAFLRFPGGNFLEGDTLADWYDWKKTIGPLVDRPTHPSPWDYRSSDGLGLLEFFEWCQDLNMQPVLAVYAGYALKGEHIDAGPKLEPYLQSALDEIEYASGATSTKWGAERAKDGHPEPFKLHYIEIGNEDEFDKSGSYEGRYAQFYDAIKKQYPQLELIATTPVKNHKMDVVDDHFYEPAQGFFSDADHYDKTDRNGPKIFVGEWATREGTPTPDFHAALADSAWMTGMERNSDIVVMSSYAPLLTNINPGGMQWDTDLIGYNAVSSYGSPSYYAQVMFSSHHGNQILSSSLSGTPVRVYQSVTRDSASGTIYLKVVNAATEPADVSVKLSGGPKISPNGQMETMTAPATEDTNTMADPKRIVPATHALPGMGESFTLHLDPLSINILTLHEEK
jgi:alpha-N-arabinofuranosidase